MAVTVRRMVDADALIYVLPVHGFGMSSLMQRFIERAGVGYLRFERPLENKVAGVVVSGRRNTHAGIHNQIINNFLLNRMIVVGSGRPVIVEGGHVGGTLRDADGIDAMRNMIRRMAGMARLIAGSELVLPGTRLHPYKESL